RLPAQPPHSQIQVHVLDVGNEALVEWLSAAVAHVPKHLNAVEGGRPTDAEDLARTLPAGLVGPSLAAVGGPAVAEEEMACAVDGVCGPIAARLEQLPCERANPGRRFPGHKEPRHVVGLEL